MNAHPRARTDGLVTEQVGDDLVVYDEATQTAHALAAQAASIWNRCDGTSTVDEIARSVALDQPQVADALEQLQDAGLLEQPPLLTRRQASKGIAAAGAAAFGARLVYSVAVPPAAAAQSPVALCTVAPNCARGQAIQCTPGNTASCNATFTGNPNRSQGISFICLGTNGGGSCYQFPSGLCYCAGNCSGQGLACGSAGAGIPCCANFSPSAAGQDFCVNGTCTQ